MGNLTPTLLLRQHYFNQIKNHELEIAGNHGRRDDFFRWVGAVFYGNSQFFHLEGTPLMFFESPLCQRSTHQALRLVLIV